MSYRLLHELNELHKKRLCYISKLEGSQENQNESHEVEQTHSNLSRLRKLLNIELNIRLRMYDFREYRTRKDTERVDEEILRAIEISYHEHVAATMGDYYAALSSDFQEAPALSRPGDWPKWHSMGVRQVSDIVEAYDKEQERLVKNSELPPEEVPMTTSLQKAFEYLKGRYSSLEVIVGFLRTYGERNKKMHPVKKFFQEGDFVRLHSAIVKSYMSIPFLGQSAQTEKMQKEARQVLELVVERYYEEFEWVEEGFSFPGRSLKNARKKHKKIASASAKGAKVSASVSPESSGTSSQSSAGPSGTFVPPVREVHDYIEFGGNDTSETSAEDARKAKSLKQKEASLKREKEASLKKQKNLQKGDRPREKSIEQGMRFLRDTCSED